jgi:hypothetical protein
MTLVGFLRRPFLCLVANNESNRLPGAGLVYWSNSGDIYRNADYPGIFTQDGYTLETLCVYTLCDGREATLADNVGIFCTHILMRTEAQERRFLYVSIMLN